MTVQDLIDELSKVEDKSVPVFVPMEGLHVVQASECNIIHEKKRILYTEDFREFERGVTVK